MTTSYKNLATIYTEQQIRSGNYLAAHKWGIFKSSKDLDVYHDRIEKISDEEVKAVNKCIRSIRRKSNG